MSHSRFLAPLGVAALAAGAVLSVGGGAAQADPTPAPPPFRTYAAVGSDTTQSVWNGLTNAGAKPAPIKNVGSWDAFGSATIQTKAAGATFVRPQGSTNGVKALSAQYDPAYPSHDWSGTVLLNNEVDFARSSSGPVSGTGLTYLPFARDAVSVALDPLAANNPTSFTTAQLAAIYGGSDDNTAGTGITYDVVTGKPKFKGNVLSPLLPQAGSGTRKFFQGSIGIVDADLGAYVEPVPSTIPENDGTQLTAPGQLIPFSAAQWIAQANGVQTNTTTGRSLLKINGQTPFVGVAPKLKSGTLFGVKDPQGNYSTPPVPGVGVFARDTYNVVPTAFIGGTPYQTTLVSILTGNAAGQLGSTPAKTIIKKFGFGTLSYLGDPAQFKSGAFQH